MTITCIQDWPHYQYVPKGYDPYKHGDVYGICSPRYDGNRCFDPYNEKKDYDPCDPDFNFGEDAIFTPKNPYFSVGLLRSLGGINTYDINGNPIHIYIGAGGVIKHIDFCHHDYENSLNLLDSVMLPPLINAHDHPEFNLINGDDMLGKDQARMGTFTNRFEWNPLWKGKLFQFLKQEKDFVTADPKHAHCDMFRYSLLLGMPATVTQGWTEQYYGDCHLGDGPIPLASANMDLAEEIFIWKPDDEAKHKTEERLKAVEELKTKRIRVIHLAEGFADNPNVKEEIKRAYESGLFGSKPEEGQKTVVIHGMGLGNDELKTMAENGWGIIWSPVSQINLYGPDGTLDVLRAMKAGVQIGLGTDWSLTGSRNILREMGAAQMVLTDYFGYDKEDAAYYVLYMASEANAKILGLEQYMLVSELANKQDPREFMDVDASVVFVKKDEILPNGKLDFTNVTEADVTLALYGGTIVFGEWDLLAELEPHAFSVFPNECPKGVFKAIAWANAFMRFDNRSFEDVYFNVQDFFPKAPEMVDCAPSKKLDIKKRGFKTKSALPSHIRESFDKAFPLNPSDKMCVGEGYPAPDKKMLERLKADPTARTY